MDVAVSVDLERQILDAITRGKRHFVYWGFNETCIRLLSALRELGVLESYTSGIIDPSPTKQGKAIYSHRILAPERATDLDIDVLVITDDAQKEDSLREYATFDARLPEVIISGVRHLAFRDSAFDEIRESCLVKSYATGYSNSLVHIYQSIKYLSDNNVKGNVAEFGMFKGGTTVFIAKALQYFGFSDVQIYGFDVFAGFPQRRSVFDLYTNPECEFGDRAAVSEHCERYSIKVIEGDIVETHRELEGMPLMLSFFDTDNYSPTRAALEMCFGQTVPGGVLAFDHFTTEERFLYTIGERMAAAEVLTDKRVFHLHGTGIFVKL